LVERLIRNVFVRIRLRVFSAIYGGIGRVKRHHSGAVGKVLGKDLGKDPFLTSSLARFPQGQAGAG
jgi:hypothetical protein